MNQNNKMMDPKTIVAVVISAAFFFGWQSYLAKKYPRTQTAMQENSSQKSELQKVNHDSVKDLEKKERGDEKISLPTIEEKTKMFPSEKSLHFGTKDIRFEVSSYGMGLRNVQILDYVGVDQKPISLGREESERLFELQLKGVQGPIIFDISEVQPGFFRGIGHIGQMTIIRDLQYDTDKKRFVNKLNIENPSEFLREGISFRISDHIEKETKKSWFFPSYKIQDFFVSTQEESKSIHFNSIQEDLHQTFKVGNLITVSSQYFTAALLNKAEIFPDFQVSASVLTAKALAEAIYKPNHTNNNIELQQVFYVGPKSIDQLKRVDADMAKIIDFGYFGFLARPLLYLMKIFASWVGNWGVAIIFLTLTVRLVVLPFNVMSIRSSKAMKKVQPMITTIREKYKDDPITLNKEMMSVMKENGANPLGGCLPALVQIPIFLALYRVIGSSVELYQSPFVGWIHDLSSHDPYFILPILMGITMFIQQKITPTPMDPAQAKILNFLPLVFSIFMLNLPSGLTLYMFVSGLFGIAQQYTLMGRPESS